METFEKADGNRSSNYVYALNNLAEVYRKTNDLENAESMYLDVIDIASEVYGKTHINYAGALNNLAKGLRLYIEG